MRFHARPMVLWERDDADFLAIETSQTARCDHLAMLAEADARGRVCADQSELLDKIAMFKEHCEQLGCLGSSFPFPDDHTRFRYFQGRGARSPGVPIHDDTHGGLVLLSGLPGSGKDHYAREHLAGVPVVSLDAIREDTGADPTGGQGRVVEEARARAREHLRALGSAPALSWAHGEPPGTGGTRNGDGRSSFDGHQVRARP